MSRTSRFSPPLPVWLPVFPGSPSFLFSLFGDLTFFLRRMSIPICLQKQPVRRRLRALASSRSFIELSPPSSLVVLSPSLPRLLEAQLCIKPSFFSRECSKSALASLQHFFQGSAPLTSASPSLPPFKKALIEAGLPSSPVSSTFLRKPCRHRNPFVNTFAFLSVSCRSAFPFSSSSSWPSRRSLLRPCLFVFSRCSLCPGGPLAFLIDPTCPRMFYPSSYVEPDSGGYTCLPSIFPSSQITLFIFLLYEPLPPS